MPSPSKPLGRKSPKPKGPSPPSSRTPPPPPPPPRKPTPPERTVEYTDRTFRKRDLTWDWSGKPEVGTDAFGRKRIIKKGRKPSRSLWIRQHLGEQGENMDYIYRMWKRYVLDLRANRPECRGCSYNDFKTTIWELKKLGLLTIMEPYEFQMRFDHDVTEPIEQPPESPVGERRGKKDIALSWVIYSGDKEARTNLLELVSSGKIPNYVDNVYTYTVSGKRVKADPLQVAWTDPRRALYPVSYARNIVRMQKSRHKTVSKGLRAMSNKQIKYQIRMLENELFRRGLKVKRREFTKEEMKKAGRTRYTEKKLEKMAEKKRLQSLRALYAIYDPTELALREIRKLIIEAVLHWGDHRVPEAEKNVKSIDYLIKYYELTDSQVQVAVERAEEEARRLATERDREKIYLEIENMVYDAVSTPKVDMMTKKVTFMPIDWVTNEIIKSLKNLHRLDDKRLKMAIENGTSRAMKKRADIEKSIKHIIRSSEVEEPTEELGEEEK